MYVQGWKSFREHVQDQTVRRTVQEQSWTVDRHFKAGVRELGFYTGHTGDLLVVSCEQ